MRMSRINIPLANKSNLPEQGPYWYPAGNPYNAAFRCECGQLFTLRRHTVTKTGIVKPSVVCPACDFHEHVKLTGWQE